MLNKINHNPSRKELRNFGWVILIGFGLIGLLVARSGRMGIATGVWGASAAVWLIAWTLPSIARPLYVAWMVFGGAIGFLMSRVVMAFIFFVVITPVAIFFRLRGRDELVLKKPSDSKGSYWKAHPKIEDKSDYEHLF